MTEAAVGIDDPTLSNGFTIAEYASAMQTIAAVDSSYTGLCVYQEQPNPSPKPTGLGGTQPPATHAPSSSSPSHMPTIDTAELVVVAESTLELQPEAASELSNEESPENAAFRAGINAITTAIERDDQCYGVSATAATRRRLQNSSSTASYVVSYNLLIELDISDADAAALIDNYTALVKADLTTGFVDSDAFVLAVQNSLAAQNASSSSFASVEVDKNATAAQVVALSVFVQTEVPTTLPTPTPTASPKSSSKSSSSDSTTIIIIVVIGGVVVLGIAAAAVFVLRPKDMKVDVYTEKGLQKPTVSTNKTVPVDGNAASSAN